jgi:chemotaxis protein methyltransferase CheR
MEKRLFDKLRAIIYEKSGISLHEGKEALVSARLGKRMRYLGIEDYREYVDRVSHDEDGTETVGLIDAISTNVTSFFREPAHFDVLGNLMSDWLKEGKKRFRFWSAACSSGEEPYSIAMTLLEAVKDQPVDLRILATDISTQALAKGKKGIYDEQRMPPVPPHLRTRYFERRKTANGVTFSATEALRKPILFRRLNLSAPPFPMTGPMDAIFCRNVLIYFGQALKHRVVACLVECLSPGGYLFLGHAESLIGVTGQLELVAPTVYRAEPRRRAGRG